MKLLAFDVEATGITDRNRANDDPGQPHIIQIGGVLRCLEASRDEHLEILIRPDGWEVTTEITDLTGLTREDCVVRGLPIGTALTEFSAWVGRADMVAAFNYDFDRLMISIEEQRTAAPSCLDDKPSICVQALCRDVLRLPGWGGKYKKPSLLEACKELLGRAPLKHHHALMDSIDCMEIYCRLVDMGMAYSHELAKY